MNISISLSPAITYAGIQNAIPVIQNIKIEQAGEVAVKDVIIKVTVSPDVLLHPLTLHVASLEPSTPLVFSVPELAIRHDRLAQMSEAERATVLVEVLVAQEVVATTSAAVEVLAYDEWAGMRQLPELLVAFSQPNSKTVATLLRRASELLHHHRQEALSGYQAPDRQAVARQIAAIYTAIADSAIHYSNPPASFTGNGQKIRLPERLMEERLGTCLDLAMLLVSCLEQAGLHPVIFLEEGHAWVGCWLYENAFSTATVDSCQQVRKRVTSGELIAIEATCLTPQSHAGFSSATRQGAEKLAEGRESKFELAIDVHRARRGQKILPLPVQRAPATEGEVEYAAAPATIDDVDLPPLSADVSIAETSGADRPSASRIDQWRARLLDLTLRNRLINFKLTKQTIPLCCPDPAKLEDILADGKAFKLGSLKDVLGESDPRSDEQQRRRSDASLSQHAASDAFLRGEVLAELTGTELDGRLTELFRAARTAQEEGGANTLFLAFGMLQWVESKDSQRKLLAPLIMVPVTLERKSVTSGFSFKRHDDETIINPTLLQLLDTQFGLQIDGIRTGVELPQDESGVDVAGIWARFARAVVDMPGFEVKHDTCLGLFSFTKYLMWKDLTDRQADLLQSPIVRQLVQLQDDAPAAEVRFPAERGLDQLKQPHELHTPIDCDSSQLAAVNAAADGLSFVLKGPPGTGKSQTITNIVADALARGRTVLFVSEKIAALNVVHERLKQLGLGPFMLELHSAKATKSGVLAQLDASLGASCQKTVSGWETEAARIGRLRSDLNAYVSALHEEHRNGLTVFDALALIVARRTWTGCRFEWPRPDVHDQQQLDELRTLVRRLGTLSALLEGVDTRTLSRIERYEWTPTWQTELLSAASDMRTQLAKLETELDQCLAASGISLKSRSQSELGRFFSLGQVLLRFRPEFAPLLGDPSYTGSLSLLHTIAVHGRRRSELSAQLLVNFNEGLLRLDAAALSQTWQQAEGHWFFKRWLTRFRIRNLLRTHHRQQTRPAETDVPTLFETLGALQQEDRHLQDHAANAARLLGGLWLHERSDWGQVEGAAQWLAEYDRSTQELAGSDIDALMTLRAELAKRLTNMAVAFAADGEIGRGLRACQQGWDTLQQQVTAVSAMAGCQPTTLLVEVTQPQVLGNLREVLQGWEQGAPHLRDWCQWQEACRAGRQLGLQPFLAALGKAHLPSSETLAYFDYCYAQWWLDRVVDITPLLQRFSAADHEQRILEFREADERYAQLTREHLKVTLASRVPAATAPAPGTPLGTLKRELQKRSRHMPVRKLLETLSGILPRLSPCLLMSPLSVAQYLDAATRFDLVIFDEASQIPTWDAVGAIARGKQVIVVGDPKQLPPTNFFSSGASEGAAAEDEVEDLESILDECIGSGLSTHTLKWHYRSRKESLIAFSNYRYYGSELITFPSPSTPDRGVTFHPVEGIYQRAGARTNRAEAEAIVTFIRQHYADPVARRRSLGVVTFSQTQQKLVEDLLDAARRSDSKLDGLISAQIKEPIFIKNLENVQGDERDIILFSICYGPDETGRVFMNFGPLNREGGQRRLNVAVTRAKEEVHVFATLRPEQMDINKSRAAGVGDLKLYLEYAIKGQQALLAHSAPTGLAPESPFEFQVRDFLVDSGWQVHPQVGCSSYRIDLAIVHPELPGSYLLAVECDGASYHSAATARDRDKLRQMVLERLGWRVHRIWSTEWWTNPEREKKRLLAAIEGALQAPVPSDPSVLDVVVPEAEPVAEPPEFESDRAYARAVEPTSEAVSAIQAAPYVPVALPVGDRDKFYEPSENQRIQAAIRQVIAAEGPVSEFVIRKRICDAYGFDRAGNRIQERLQILQRGLGGNGKENDRMFFWPGDMMLPSWTGFRQAGGRDVADIHVQELANLARAALEEVVVADEAVLIKRMGSLLGIQRVTASTQERLRNGLLRLQSTGKVEEVVGGFRLVT